MTFGRTSNFSYLDVQTRLRILQDILRKKNQSVLFIYLFEPTLAAVLHGTKLIFDALVEAQRCWMTDGDDLLTLYGTYEKKRKVQLLSIDQTMVS